MILTFFITITSRPAEKAELLTQISLSEEPRVSTPRDAGREGDSPTAVRPGRDTPERCRGYRRRRGGDPGHLPLRPGEPIPRGTRGAAGYTRGGGGTAEAPAQGPTAPAPRRQPQLLPPGSARGCGSASSPPRYAQRHIDAFSALFFLGGVINLQPVPPGEQPQRNVTDISGATAASPSKIHDEGGFGCPPPAPTYLCRCSWRAGGAAPAAAPAARHRTPAGDTIPARRRAARSGAAALRPPGRCRAPTVEARSGAARRAPWEV